MKINFLLKVILVGLFLSQPSLAQQTFGAEVANEKIKLLN